MCFHSLPTFAALIPPFLSFSFSPGFISLYIVCWFFVCHVRSLAISFIMVQACLSFKRRRPSVPYSPKSAIPEHEYTEPVREFRLGSSHSTLQDYVDTPSSAFSPDHADSILKEHERRRAHSDSDSRPRHRHGSFSRLRKIKSAPVAMNLPVVHEKLPGVREMDGQRRASEADKSSKMVTRVQNPVNTPTSVRVPPQLFQASSNASLSSSPPSSAGSDLSTLSNSSTLIGSAPSPDLYGEDRHPVAIATHLEPLQEEPEVQIPRLPSLKVNSRLSIHLAPLTLKIPQRENSTVTGPEPRIIPQLEPAKQIPQTEFNSESSPEPSPSKRPSSQRSSKRVTFSSAPDSVITPSKASFEPGHLNKRPSWSSVFLITAPDGARPSLSRHSSAKSPTTAKSILRRTSSFQDTLPTAEEPRPSGVTVKSLKQLQSEYVSNKDTILKDRVAPNTMMEKNLKRLPRRGNSLRKTEPLPVAPQTAPSTRPASKHTRQPVIIHVPAASSPPSSSSSNKSYNSSSDSEKENYFKTVTLNEPIRSTQREFKLAPAPAPRTSVVHGGEKKERRHSRRSSVQNNHEAKWLRRGSVFGGVKSPPPVPPLPQGMMAM